MRNLLLFFVVLVIFACQKERITTNKSLLLTIPVDTLRFDTVFTTTGTATLQVKIFNPHNEGIRIESIQLAGGAASPFKINVNGQPGPIVENIEIQANDSAYVFIAARIDPTNNTLPFVVRDSIEVAYNGNQKTVQLEAYGQNAHFIRKGRIRTAETWTADLPYVLLGACEIEKDAHLTIAEGCKIYAHADAPIIVKGQLTVLGQKWDSTKVIFSGDRLDQPYRSMPGSWPGIYFTVESHDNMVQHAVIKNAYQGIVVAASPLAAGLTLQETIIDNAYDAGILALNSSITATNILISNCGKSLVLQEGGNYQFTHATIAAFSTTYIPHKEPVLSISNVAVGGTSNKLDAVFRNCIFWGASGDVVPNEIVITKRGTVPFNLLFDGMLLPPATVLDGATVTQPPVTADPEFASINEENQFYDFHLKETSPAIKSGVPGGVSLDLDGQPRPAANPDLGAYQKQ